MIRDEFGLRRIVFDDAHAAGSLRALLALAPALPRTLDREAVEGHLAGQPLVDRTCLAAVRAVPPGHELIRADNGLLATRPHAPRIERGDLASSLRAAIAGALRDAPRPLAVALSGGLDSAVVLALARELEPGIAAVVLAPRLAGYSELVEATATARSVGARCEVFEVTADDLRAALPDAIACFEEPLFNLHPVAKLLLARAARAAGIATLLTGDGADQVFTRDVTADYLPLVGAAFERAGVRLAPPFLHDAVIAHILSLPPDDDKRALRDVAATLPVPAALVGGRKQGRLAPPISLDGLVPPARLAALADLLGRSLPPLDDDRVRVRWTTLALLVDALGAWS